MSASRSVFYVFLDVVGFSRERSIDDQVAIIDFLYNYVNMALNAISPTISHADRIFLPTGDGICIALLGNISPSAPLTIALDILANIASHNEPLPNSDPRRFEVRIGINDARDDAVTDINGQPNIVGAGINMAQRIMSLGQGGQIYLGETAFQSISARFIGGASRTPSFRQGRAIVKHGVSINVYQYIAPGRIGLNTAKPIPNLTKLTGYYIAHAIKHEAFLRSLTHSTEFTASVALLYCLAWQSKLGGASPMVAADSDTDMRLLIDKFSSEREVRFLCVGLGNLAIDKEFASLQDCFDHEDDITRRYVFINSHGKDRLRHDCPEIWEEFSF